ncbi:hypothetical protein [Pseudoclavibacter sp. RFBB5]|nr:hypothetical protein [Pseudoclavibacter sp. RFBB5]
MELSPLIVIGIIVALIAAAGVAATLVVMMRDGYRARPLQSNYDSRQPL